VTGEGGDDGTGADVRRIDDDRDRGGVDVSIEMLFGTLSLLLLIVVVFEAAAYWHARNVLDDAAADGARVAAAFDGTCARGIAVARASVERQAPGWSDDVSIVCTDGTSRTVTISATTPGLIAEVTGMRVRVSESAPRER
jgi:hypothetical protein